MTSRRALTAFVAHLIAVEKQAPQTRARRRAEPERAIALYVDTGESVVAPGRILRRSA